MAATLELEPDTIVRSVLDSVAHVRSSVVARATEERRALRADEVQWLTKGDVARFTKAEWEALPDSARVNFGPVSAEEARRSITEKQASLVAEKRAQYQASLGRVAQANKALEDGVLRLKQAIQQAQQDSDYRKAQLLDAEAQMQSIEAQAAREVQAMLGGLQAQDAPKGRPVK